MGSFLLFQVQPVIGRYILPWFGGGASVWTACMLFFQIFLLGGYAYAYLLTRYLPPRKQVVLHLALLSASLLLMPVTPAETWKPVDSNNPVFRIVVLLCFTIGGPFLLLASTGPLIQKWFSGSFPHQSPYRLFALSNFASLLALLSYPFIIEPFIGIKIQTQFWSFGYIVFALAVGWCAACVYLESGSQNQDVPRDDEDESAPAMGPVLLWLALSACGVVVLLASTNEVTQNIFPIPFLWVLPLSLYLASFILCFENERWYVRKIWVTVFCVSIFPAVFLFHFGKVDSLVYQIALCSITLFSACMVCHGELARLKPVSRYLTSFYLWIAFGGALGGVFVNLIAPSLFDRYWEYPIGLLGVYLLVGICGFREQKLSNTLPSRKVRTKEKSSVFKNASPVKWAWGTLGLVFLFLYGGSIYILESMDIASHRNFYGRLHVTEVEKQPGFRLRSLVDGQITHGEQFLKPDYRKIPTLYFRYESGVGVAVRHFNEKKNLRMGVIGLGAGTISSYTRQGDVLRFYELNPAVEQVAYKYFYYLKDCQADYKIIMGDARVSLERELAESGGQNFDILVVDAFSSDNIPVHLATREAFALYWKHLNHNGILAFHISNAYLDLTPVIRNLADLSGKQTISVIAEPDFISQSRASWILVTSNDAFFDNKNLKESFTPWPDTPVKPVVWTDDYSDLLSVLK